MDSGAFSAWTQGMEIDIDNYADFALENLNYISYVVNLDVIPSKWGKRPSKEEADQAARQGWENYKYMVKKGIPEDRIIHVFHQDEEFSWLNKFVKEGLKYIGISPANDRNVKEKILWLDQCMNHITDSEGMPLNKWHGFAVTSLRIMMRYPWYSVDSSSWAAISRMGAIIIPRLKNYKWAYDKQSWILGVTPRSPYRNKITKHIDNLSPAMKKMALEYIHSKGYRLGKSVFKKVSPEYRLKSNEIWYEKGRIVEIIKKKGIINDHRQRNEINILYFQDLASSMPEWPWPFEKKRRRGFVL